MTPADLNNKLICFITLSRKGSYMVHIGRCRTTERVKVTGSSNRMKTLEEAVAEMEEGATEFFEPVTVFYGVVRETNMWYKIEDILAASTLLDEMKAKLDIGEPINADEIHHRRRL